MHWSGCKRSVIGRQSHVATIPPLIGACVLMAYPCHAPVRKGSMCRLLAGAHQQASSTCWPRMTANDAAATHDLHTAWKPSNECRTPCHHTWCVPNCRDIHANILAQAHRHGCRIDHLHAASPASSEDTGPATAGQPTRHPQVYRITHCSKLQHAAT